MNRIRTNWQAKVKDGDTVVLPGDFSWATKLEDTLEDFRFLASLPGEKIMLKGNHDYWWNSISRLRRVLPEGMSAIELLPKAVERNVAFVPGAAFYADNADQRTLRLSFVTSTVEQIATGIAALAAAIREHKG
jgi:predicted phosphohydrolase